MNSQNSSNTLFKKINLYIVIKDIEHLKTMNFIPLFKLLSTNNYGIFSAIRITLNFYITILSNTSALAFLLYKNIIFIHY